MTTIKISIHDSNILEVKQNLLGMINYCCSKISEQPSIRFNVDSDTDDHTFILNYSDIDSAELFLEHFFTQTKYPDGSFKPVNRNSIAVYSPDGELANMIVNEENIVTKYEISLLDKIVSDLAQTQIEILKTQKDIVERLNGIETFLHKSGIIHYETMLNNLLEMLGQLDLIDVEESKKNLTYTQH